MSALQSRPATTRTDLTTMCALIVARRAAGVVPIWPTVANLRNDWLEIVARQHLAAQMWGRDGVLCGFALLEWQYRILNIVLEPYNPDMAVVDSAIDWGLAQMRAASLQSDAPLRMRVRPLESDEQLIALLERRGFVRDSRDALRMTRSLHKPIPSPELPAGFVIRPLAGEHEIDAFLALHYEAFGARYKTAAFRQIYMREPDYDAALDLVAVAPDGTLAAFCVCSIDHEENAHTANTSGWTDPIGTRPQFQRRGLAHALILEGLLRLRDRGIATAILGTGGDNLAAQRVYTSLGYQIVGTIVSYSKEVMG